MRVIGNAIRGFGRPRLLCARDDLHAQQYLLTDTAHKFNNIIRRNSSSASLVVTHLPLPHKVSKSSEFMEYVDTIFKDVDNIILIQGTGVEYLTTVA